MQSKLNFYLAGENFERFMAFKEKFGTSFNNTAVAAAVLKKAETMENLERLYSPKEIDELIAARAS